MKNRIFNKLAVMAMSVFILTSVSFGQGVGTKLQTIIKPVIVDVVAKGPGALYIAQVGNDMFFWIINDSNMKVTRIANVSLQTTPASTRNIKVTVSSGITGVFYADNLTFSSALTLSLTGTLDNPKCPQCTVSMPLKTDSQFTWVNWLTPIGNSSTPIIAGDNISKIIAKQNEIYEVAGKTIKAMEGLEMNFVEMQKSSLKDYYQQSETSLNELNTKTQNTYNTMLDFENKLKTKGSADEIKINNEGTTLQNYTNAEFPKFALGFNNCGKLNQIIEKSTRFTDSLKVDLDSPAGESFNETTAITNASTDAKIDSFGIDALDLLDDIEPCLDNLYVNFENIGDNNPNSPMSETAKQNMISQTDYEALGNQMETFALNTEKDIDNWSATLETRFNNLDKLGIAGNSGTSLGNTSGNTTGRGSIVLGNPNNTQTQIVLQNLNNSQPATNYLDLLKKSQAVASPILSYVSTKSQGASPQENVPFSYNLKVSATNVGNSVSACQNGSYTTINLQAAKIIIATPWNDAITGDSGINIILGLSGDDCINGKESFDFILGNGGNDDINGHDGHDFLFGDTLGFLNNGKDKIIGGKGETHTFEITPTLYAEFDIGNFISGDGGDDNLVGFGENDPNNDYEFRFADVIIGDGFAGNDSGNDYINGDGGCDFLFGQAKNDELINTQYGVFKLKPGQNLPGNKFSCGSFFAGNEGDDKITGTNTSSGIDLTPPVRTFGDIITGGSENDIINAGDGGDFIFGDKLVAPSTGNDIVNAGNGMDFALAQKGDDKINGGDMTDVIAGNDGKDFIYADAGTFSILIGGIDQDQIFGDNGYDLAIAGKGDDLIYAKEGGFDLIVSWDGNDSIWGGDGINTADAIFSNDGNDVIFNGDGKIDLTFAGKGVDKVFGNQGFDVIFGQQNLSNEIIRCGEKRADSNIEQLFGNEGVDFIVGGMGHDNINGGDDVDILIGNECEDWINGENGVDFAFGNTDDDKITGGDNPDFLAGGDGFDNVSGNNSLDIILGGDKDDKLFGGVDSDLIIGGNGNDYIEGNEAADLVFGSNGSDTIYGNNPAFATDQYDFNVLIGGEQNDTIYGGETSDVILGGKHDDHILGNGGSDLLIGMADADTIEGGSGTNLLLGRNGNDELIGGQHDDFMFGEDDNDTFRDENGGFNLSWGDDGVDTFYTGTGRNFAFGNAQNDTFNLCDDGKPDKRDFGFGGNGLNSFTRNPSDYKDWTFNGSRSDCP